MNKQPTLDEPEPAVAGPITYEHLEELVKLRTEELNRTKQQLALEMGRRLETEEVLKAERRRFWAVFDRLPALVYLQASDYSIPYANFFFRERFGAPMADPCYRVLRGRLEPCEVCPILQVRGNGTSLQWEWTAGDGRVYQSYSCPFPNVKGGELVLTFSVDITERGQAAMVPYWSEQKFPRSFYSSPHLVTVSTLEDGRYVEVNDSFLRTMGYDRREVIGRSSTHLNIWGTPGDRERLVRLLRKEGMVRNWEVDLRLKSGEIRTMLMGAEVIDVGGIPHLLSIAKDVTDCRRAQKALSLSEERFAKAFNHSPVMMFIASLQDGKLIDANHSFCRVTGYEREEALGKTMGELNFWAGSENAYGIRQSIIDNNGLIDHEVSFCTKSGDMRVGLLSVQMIDIGDEPYMLCILNDITKRKRMEKEMVRLERLNLVGEMAASIGHEIRNPMTTVRGFLQLLKEAKENNETKEFFDIMIEELDRANAIIAEFLFLARNKVIDVEARNLNSIVNSILPLIQAGATAQDKHVELETGEVPDLFLDEKEIRHLILNLAHNGLEAMSAGGTLLIRTFIEDEDIVLAVHDEGSGIALGVLEKLGTPFVTTKENGTGLGLPVCYGIAARHGATIDVETGPCGTTFFVRFSQTPGRVVLTG